MLKPIKAERNQVRPEDVCLGQVINKKNRDPDQHSISVDDIWLKKSVEPVVMGPKLWDKKALIK